MITRTVIRTGGGGGSGGAKLPSTLFHLSGTIRDEAVDWAAGAMGIFKLKMNVDSSAVTEDTILSGGLYATAEGFEATDGVNTAYLPATLETGVKLVVGLRTETDGVRTFMRLVRIS